MFDIETKLEESTINFHWKLNGLALPLGAPAMKCEISSVLIPVAGFAAEDGRLLGFA